MHFHIICNKESQKKSLSTSVYLHLLKSHLRGVNFALLLGLAHVDAAYSPSTFHFHASGLRRKLQGRKGAVLT